MEHADCDQYLEILMNLIKVYHKFKTKAIKVREPPLCPFVFMLALSQQHSDVALIASLTSPMMLKIKPTWCGSQMGGGRLTIYAAAWLLVVV